MADYRYCSRCGEEYNASHGPHICNPLIIIRNMLAGQADKEVRQREGKKK